MGYLSLILMMIYGKTLAWMTMWMDLFLGGSGMKVLGMVSRLSWGLTAAVRRKLDYIRSIVPYRSG
jgi:hypothetical protein